MAMLPKNTDVVKSVNEELDLVHISLYGKQRRLSIRRDSDISIFNILRKTIFEHRCKLAHRFKAGMK